MSHNTLPDAVAHFLTGLSTGDSSALRRGLALSVVGVASDDRLRGVEAMVTLVNSSPVFTGGASWDVIYAMDSEVVMTSSAGDQLQLILDCGRISFVRVTEAVAVSSGAVAA